MSRVKVSSPITLFSTKVNMLYTRGEQESNVISSVSCVRDRMMCALSASLSRNHVTFNSLSHISKMPKRSLLL